MVKGRDEDVELPQLSQMRAPPDLETVIGAAAQHFGDDPSAYIEGRRCDGLGRAVAAYPVRRLCAASDCEIATRLGCRNVSSVSGACRRVHAAAAEDRHFSSALAQLRESRSP